MSHTYIANIISKITFSPEGPQPQTIFSEGQVKVVSAGLNARQIIPTHPEGLAVYTFLEGNGWMNVNGERLAVGPGSVIITLEGARRGIEAENQLVFIAVRITDLPVEKRVV